MRRPPQGLNCEAQKAVGGFVGLKGGLSCQFKGVFGGGGEESVINVGRLQGADVAQRQV
jgi:hypothetical protein